MLLDLGMPPPDGFDVAEQVRRMPGGDAIRIIAVTGWGQEADRRRTRECGFDSHMVKPLNAEDVAIAVGLTVH
jgi:CheY-like chemotaxis protein